MPHPTGMAAQELPEPTAMLGLSSSGVKKSIESHIRDATTIILAETKRDELLVRGDRDSICDVLDKLKDDPRCTADPAVVRGLLEFARSGTTEEQKLHIAKIVGGMKLFSDTERNPSIGRPIAKKGEEQGISNDFKINKNRLRIGHRYLLYRTEPMRCHKMTFVDAAFLSTPSGPVIHKAYPFVVKNKFKGSFELDFFETKDGRGILAVPEDERGGWLEVFPEGKQPVSPAQAAQSLFLRGNLEQGLKRCMRIGASCTLPYDVYIDKKDDVELCPRSKARYQYLSVPTDWHWKRAEEALESCGITTEEAEQVLAEDREALAQEVAEGAAELRPKQVDETAEVPDTPNDSNIGIEGAPPDRKRAKVDHDCRPLHISKTAVEPEPEPADESALQSILKESVHPAQNISPSQGPVGPNDGRKNTPELAFEQDVGVVYGQKSLLNPVPGKHLGVVNVSQPVTKSPSIKSKGPLPDQDSMLRSATRRRGAAGAGSQRTGDTRQGTITSKMMGMIDNLQDGLGLGSKRKRPDDLD